MLLIKSRHELHEFARTAEGAAGGESTEANEGNEGSEAGDLRAGGLQFAIGAKAGSSRGGGLIPNGGRGSRVEARGSRFARGCGQSWKGSHSGLGVESFWLFGLNRRSEEATSRPGDNLYVSGGGARILVGEIGARAQVRGEDFEWLAA